MARQLELWKQYLILIPVYISGLLVGQWYQRECGLIMSRFRDKSALYGRELQPGEPPSWP